MKLNEVKNEEQLNRFADKNNFFDSQHPYYVAEVQACNQIYIEAMRIEEENEPLAFAMLRLYFKTKEMLCEEYDGFVAPNIYKGLEQRGIKFIA